jgi:hypothetical protein
MEAAAGLAGALFGRRGSTEVWQDREVRFDLSQAQLAPRRGEAVLETLVRFRRYQHQTATSGIADAHGTWLAAFIAP